MPELSPCPRPLVPLQQRQRSSVRLLNAAAGTTLSHVTRTGVARHGSSIALRWTLARNSGITGFGVYAGMHRLNSRVIPVHAARGYRYTTSGRGTGPYTLNILLRHGQQIVPLGG